MNGLNLSFSVGTTKINGKKKVGSTTGNSKNCEKVGEGRDN